MQITHMLSTHTQTRIALTAALLAMLSGCTVGPNHKPPRAATPDAYHALGTSKEPNALSTAVAGETASISTWWKQFKDPMLDALVTRAVEGNHDLKIARERIIQARALRMVQESRLKPQVNIGAGVRRSRNSSNTGQFGIGLQDLNLFEFGMDAAWELDVFGGLQRGVEAARADEEGQENARRDTLITLIAEIGRNYTELRSYQQRLAVAQRTIAAQEETVSLTRSRSTAGLSADLEVTQAEAQLASRRSQIPPIEISLAQSAHRLSVLVGNEPGALQSELATVGAVPMPPAEIPVGLPSDLLRRRPDIRQAEQAVAAACARIGVATAELYPKFDLSAGLGLRSEELPELFEGRSRYWSIGPGVRWSVFNGGAVQANIDAATSVEREALLRYEQAVLLSLEDVENAITSFTREQSRLRSLESAVASYNRAVELAEDRYRTGIGDFLNVLDSQQRLYDAQDQLENSRASVSRSAVALYKSLGGGWDPAEAAQAEIGTDGKAAAGQPTTDAATTARATRSAE